VLHRRRSRRSTRQTRRAGVPSIGGKSQQHRGVGSAATSERGKTMKGNAVALKETSESVGTADVAPSPSRSKLDHVPLRLLRCREVEERTGLSRSTIWRLEHRSAFPKRIRVSVNVVAWLEDEVAAWIQSRVDRVAM
jgi:prophage regulatory protein